MGDPTTSSPIGDSGSMDEAARCAVFVLDASGNVVATNHSGHHFFGAQDRPLAGQPFAGFFVGPATTPETESAEARWASLRAATLDRWAELVAWKSGNGPRNVQVRIERSIGGAGTYFATIQSR